MSTRIAMISEHASPLADLGGRVEILPYLENYSTSSVIEKIRHSLVDSRSEERNELSEVRLKKRHER